MKYQSHHKRFSKLAAVACLSALLGLGFSSAASAETHIDVYDDGGGVIAYATSSDDVLSINIRVVGPNGYIYEERAEDSSIEWAPESELPDGVYSWEVWTVTAERGAPMREISVPRPSPQAGQSVDSISPHQAADQVGTDLDEIPLERFFSPEHKEVHRATGSFKSEGGIMLEIVDEQAIPFSHQYRPNPIERAIGAVIDFLVPSAYAETFSTNVRIEKSTPRFYLDNTASGQGEQQFWVGAASNDLYFRHDDGTGTDYARFEHGAPEDSLRIRSGTQPRVGIGTSTPTTGMHISRTAPRIRLEDTFESQSWYINNVNQGRFEIRETSGGGVGAFAIDAGAPEAAIYVRSNGRVGIGTSEAVEALHLVDSVHNYPAIQYSDNDVVWRVGAFSDPAWGIRNVRDLSHPFIVHDDAPQDALRIRGAGIGMGISIPEAALHVHGTDGTAQILVEETDAGNSTLYRLVNNGHVRFRMDNSSTGDNWEFRTTGGTGDDNQFAINKVGTPGQELRVDGQGNLIVRGSVFPGSSRSIKQDIEKLDAESLLARLGELSLHEWSYTAAPENRHIGPMAEDFHATFGLGINDKTISPSDMAGIALAAAQALQQKNAQVYAENRELRERLDRLEQAVLATSH